MVKVTAKTKVDKPCQKSAVILARKYDKDLSDAIKSDTSHPSINIGFNANTLSLRELQEISNESPLGSIALDASQYSEVLEDSDVVHEGEGKSILGPLQEDL